MNIFIRWVLLSLSLALTLSACGGGGGNSSNNQQPPPPVDTDLDWDQGNWDEKDWQ